jgi:hypothetical protein
MKALVSHRPTVHATNGGLHHATAKAGLGDTTSDFADLYGVNDPSVYSIPTPSPAVDWSKMISSVTNSFTSVFKAIQPIPAGCQSVAGPYGTSLQCAGAGNGLNTMSLPSLGGSSIWLIAALGIGAVLLLKK